VIRLGLVAALFVVGCYGVELDGAPGPADEPLECVVESGSYGTSRACIDVCVRAPLSFALGTCEAPAECWRLRHYQYIPVLRLRGAGGTPSFSARDCE
jgi:hypothetical protein